MDKTKRFMAFAGLYYILHLYAMLRYTRVRPSQLKRKTRPDHTRQERSNHTRPAQTTDKPTSTLKLKSMRECLQDRRPKSFGHLEMEENASKCTAFKVSGSGSRRPWKTWKEVIIRDLKKNVNKDLAKDRNA